MNKELKITFENGLFVCYLLTTTPYPWEKPYKEIIETIRSNNFNNLLEQIKDNGWSELLTKNI